MNDITATIFRGRKAVPEKLKKYGFKLKGESYCIKKILSHSGFEMTIEISSGDISAEVSDTDTGEPYTLHLAKSAAGSFVGMVKYEYEEILKDIAAKCCDSEIFKTEYAKKLLSFAYEKYDDEPEFLWDKFPEFAVLRRKDSQKWYGIVMRIPAEKIGLNSKEIIEVVNLHEKNEVVEKLVDETKYFIGYHMNKKYWYTIILDGRVDFEEIAERLDNSYQLAEKKKSARK